MYPLGGPDGEPDGANERVSDSGRGEGCGDVSRSVSSHHEPEPRRDGEAGLGVVDVQPGGVIGRHVLRWDVLERRRFVRHLELWPGPVGSNNPPPIS